MRKQLIELRNKMAQCGIDIYIIPTTDYHGSEYVNDYFKCREYVSGFTGSAGTLIVTADFAGLWTDGRYFIQAAQQLEGSGIELMKMGEENVPTIEGYLDSLYAKGTAAVIGFDGFIDEIVYVVDKRTSPTEYSRVRTLREYGERIAASSGLSSNVEIVPAFKKLGGNAPIFALGLQRYGAGLTYIGCTGQNATDAVFAEMARDARIIGVCDPGQTDAMEFDDGKLIRSKLESLNHMTWQNLIAKVAWKSWQACWTARA